MERIELSGGATAYEATGPKDAPAVVLVHGMTSPSFVWDRTVPALAGAHRVLRYDLLGRGESDRPAVRYDLALYLAQLDELAARVFGERPVALVGYSWGAGIAAAWADVSPSRVHRLVLLAPGGLRAELGARLLALPLAGEVAVRIIGRRFLVEDLNRCFLEPRAQSEYLARVLAQLDVPGFEHAFLSTLRHVPSDLGSYYARLERHAFPVDVLWGTRDAKVPMSLAQVLRRAVPRARIHPLEGCAHAAQVEHPELFNAALRRLLSAAP